MPRLTVLTSFGMRRMTSRMASMAGTEPPGEFTQKLMSPRGSSAESRSSCEHSRLPASWSSSVPSTMIRWPISRCWSSWSNGTAPVGCGAMRPSHPARAPGGRRCCPEQICSQQRSAVPPPAGYPDRTTRRLQEAGMRYLMLICHDDGVRPSQEELAADPAHQRWLADVTSRGAFLGGERLRPVETATTVRVREGRTLVTDGPFAETKEFVGGYVLLACADLDEALEIAAGHPIARRGTIEVRPVWER